METKSRIVVVRIWTMRWETGKIPFNVYRVSVLKDVVELDSDDGCTTLWMYLIPMTVCTYLILHLKMIKMVNFMLCIFYHAEECFNAIY